MTLKDLFKKENEIIITIPLANKYHIYIEGLDEYGGASIDKVEDIKELCVELHETSVDMVCDMNCYNITLNTDIEEVVSIGMSLVDREESIRDLITLYKEISFDEFVDICYEKNLISEDLYKDFLKDIEEIDDESPLYINIVCEFLDIVGITEENFERLSEYLEKKENRDE